MQRLNADLWKGFQQFSNVRAQRICPYCRGDLTFAFRACRAALTLRGKDARVHLGDAALCPLGVLLKLLSGCKVSVTACGLDLTYPRAWYQRLMRWSLPQMDHVVCISRATAIDARKRGVVDEHLSIIPCGIWPDDHQISTRRDHQKPRLITVGRLIPRKGVVWFLSEVFPILLKAHPAIEYTIIGSGPDAEHIQRVIIKNCYQKQVKLIQDATDQDLRSALAEATIFVMPNIPIQNDPEGFGIVCIEASAVGVPVAASRLEGIQDAVIDQKTGCFFQPNDASSCVRCIEKMLARTWDRNLVRSETLKHFAWPALLSSYHHDVFHFS